MEVHTCAVFQLKKSGITILINIKKPTTNLQVQGDKLIDAFTYFTKTKEALRDSGRKVSRRFHVFYEKPKTNLQVEGAKLIDAFTYLTKKPTSPTNPTRIGR